MRTRWAMDTRRVLRRALPDCPPCKDKLRRFSTDSRDRQTQRFGQFFITLEVTEMLRRCDSGVVTGRVRVAQLEEFDRRGDGIVSAGNRQVVATAANSVRLRDNHALLPPRQW